MGSPTCYSRIERPEHSPTRCGLADFLGDDNTEILFQNSATSQLAYWTLNGPSVVDIELPTPSLPGSVWTVAAWADFRTDNSLFFGDGGGIPDILFQNNVTGDL